MRLLAVVLICCSSLSLAQAPAVTPSCVILKRASGGEHAWSGIEFYYVEGQYPAGYNFRTNLRGRHVRKLIKMGSKLAIVEPNYTLPQLEQARASCSSTLETK